MCPWKLLLLLVPACGAIDPPPFHCESDEQCSQSAESGICSEVGFCAFRDETCESGYRYGAHADDELANTCLAR